MNKPTHLSKVSEWQTWLKQFMPAKTAKGIACSVRNKLVIKHANEFNLKNKKAENGLTLLKQKYPKFSKNNTSLARIATTAAQNSNRRLSNWTSPKSSTLIKKKGDYDALNMGRYKGKFNRIIWNYEPRYTSYYRISQNKKSIIYVWGFEGEMNKKIVHAPKGMQFERDDKGLLLKRLSDGMDYHPSTEDLLNARFATLIRQIMANNYKLRIEAKRIAKNHERFERIFQKDIPTTMVTLFDSRKAGNCIEGTLSFAQHRLGINREEILKGGFLFKVNAKKLMDKNEPRAINAVRAAWNRETLVCI